MGSVRNGKRLFGMALAVLVVAALVCPTAMAKMTLKDKAGDKDIKLQIYGFSQFEMRGGEGWGHFKNRPDTATADPNDFLSGPDFQAQRIRVGFNYFHAGPIAGKLFLDFNQSFTSDEGGLRKVIKDAFVAYKFNNSAFLRLGMIKTPLGMSFTIPGWNLDNIERNALDKGLVLERDFGLMLSGRLIGQEGYEGKKQMKVNGLEMGNERQGYGFGYDLGVFNPAGRSSAVTWNNSIRGDALAYVARAHYDYGPELHVELAYGVSEKAGGTLAPTDEDYEVIDFGIASELKDYGLELKFEYINGNNIRGAKDREQTTMVFTVGYMLQPWVQAVVKHYMAEHQASAAATETDLQNTYIGFNFYPSRVSDKHRDLQRHKIVVNYIMTGGDDGLATGTWDGLGGYDDSAYAVQWQYKF